MFRTSSEDSLFGRSPHKEVTKRSQFLAHRCESHGVSELLEAAKVVTFDARLESELGPEQAMFAQGCLRGWDALPRPDLPLTLGLGVVMCVPPSSSAPDMTAGLKSSLAKACRPGVLPSASPSCRSTTPNRSGASSRSCARKARP